MAIEDFPFTTFLALIGLAIGLLLPSGLDIIGSYDYTQIAKDPANFLTGFVIGMPVAVMVEAFSGLIGALFMGLIGLMIDGFRGAFSGRTY